jgi:hypothetical protein
MSPLTLPGTIPGLRLHSAPVIYLRTGDRGVAMLTPDGRIVVMFCPAGARGPWTEAASPDELALDLSDPTGRAHAAWWLADEPGNESVVSRRRESPRWMCCPGASNDPGDRLWHLTGYGCAPYRDAFEGEHDPRVVVPALAALNPNDPRLLPDGSRWVDAEALRLVCLHVAGVSP